MVQDANVKRMHTEKLLKEAQSSVSLISPRLAAQVNPRRIKRVSLSRRVVIDSGVGCGCIVSPRCNYTGFTL